MNKEEDSFNLKKRLRSFRYAFAGLGNLLRREHNARIHLAAALLVTTLGLLLKLAPSEWVLLAIVIFLVLITEILNTALEELCDQVSTEKLERIKRIKDYGAAAVFLSALLAVLAGLLIFIPRLIQWIEHIN